MMGADLYIEAINEPIQKKWRPKLDKLVARRDAATKQGDKKGAKLVQKEVERVYNTMFAKGYFRDSYNNSSVMWRMDISWWSDVTPKLDKEGNLDVNGVQWLLEQVNSRELRPLTLEEMKMKPDLKAHKVRGWGIENAKPKDVASWNRYFVKKKKALIRFLQTAIKLHQPITCSL